ncbi:MULTISPECIES: Uma2 family endonuclease [unclassified Nostoc]|uniref:Uma2 family endonuclease n=1 Tax=unclassified Nostoc TaxID=2593658 RepID=UPI002AD47627|nr:Uma2 family endonuclease [Nostoc sp. DedQUE03]MDZ7977053.1 Uma2 family endonuclease [Nostoc sp. DedQUE03]MDZ8049698.1 Uma2 family endonuclease [Nostoc sp. DedQUE02]
MTQTQHPTKLLTFAEFLAYDDPTDTRYELVDGELVEMPTESQENCDIAKFLLFELAKHFPITLLAYKDIEVEVSGRRATCRLPDLVLHTKESKAALIGSPRNLITRDMPPPALVVEVVSPGTENRSRDYRYKRTEYAARGITEYWIVDPELKQITVCKWVEGQYEDTVLKGTATIASDIVPDWELIVEQVFAVTN